MILGYLGNKAETYYGEALAIVRAGDENEIRITAFDGNNQSEILVPVVTK